MLTYCYAVWAEFVKFIGGQSGLLHWILYVLALICCAILGKEERKKLFWPSVLVLIFFFNPIFYALIGARFLSGVYWRLLWMLPVSFVIAYTVVQLAYRFQKMAVRIGAVILACISIMITGDRIFSAQTYTKKENDYEISQAAIAVSDVVMSRLVDWKEIIIVPNELLCHVRQYSCSVGLLYGRNFGGFITDIGEEEYQVYLEMCKEEPDVELITRIARDKNCRYIVFNMAFHKVPSDLTAYGYEKVTELEEGYVIYCRSSV